MNSEAQVFTICRRDDGACTCRAGRTHVKTSHCFTVTKTLLEEAGGVASLGENVP